MRLTIIIPTKNRVDSLKRTVNSINNQSYQNILIVIIDQSENRNSYYENIKNINYYHKPEIKSLVEAKKYSLKIVKDKYIGFLDDDVELDKNFIKHIVEGIENLDPIGISGVDDLAREKNIIIYLLKKIFLVGNFADKRIYYLNNDKIVKTNKLSGGYSFFKRKIIEQIEFRNNDLFHINEDVDISWRIRKKYKNTFYINRKAKLKHHTNNINTINMNNIDLISNKITQNISTTLFLYKIHLNKYLNFFPLIWFFFGYFLLINVLCIKFKKFRFYLDYINGFKEYYDKKELISS